MIIYTGIFYMSKNLPEPTLEKVIDFPHTTLAFKPTKDLSKFFGARFIVEVVGYGNDGKNEGLKVNILDGPSEVFEAFKEVEVPHITLSCSKEGKPVNTKNLDFQPCKKFRVEGVFGGFNGKFVELSESRHN